MLIELSLMSSNNVFFFCMASTTNNHYCVRDSAVCARVHLCENDVSERERKKSLFISVMKRVSMGLKRETRRREERDREREGGRDRRLFKSITLSNCQCCRRGEKRIEGPGEGGDRGVDLVL